MSIDENPEIFRKVARAAAQAAGAILRANWQLPKAIDYKGAIDLVTSADRDSERKIIEVIRHHFPDHSILAEEESDIQNAQSAYRWIVDPLDGTTNFAHGHPQFCVSIALEQRGRIILGLVYDPIRDECSKRCSARARLSTAKHCASRR
jgi:myo-inositol-1(or 4)-monophosphatase